MKGITILASASIIGLITVLILASGVNASQPPRDYYLALGDSIAVGQGARVPDRFGYVGLFQHFYRVDNRGTERFADLAVPGETSLSFLNGQMDLALEVINDPGTEVQVVTLTIGANDFLPLMRSQLCAPDPTAPACQLAVAIALGGFAVNYYVILTQLNAALAQDAGEGRLLVTTYYNPFDGTGATLEAPLDVALLGVDGKVDCAANMSNPARVGVNDIITCIGIQLGAEVVDTYPLFSESALDMTHISEGDIHPNNDGHRSIADAVIAVFQGGGPQSSQ